jgi:hypothetical protein
MCDKQPKLKENLQLKAKLNEQMDSYIIGNMDQTVEDGLAARLCLFKTVTSHRG